MPKKSRAGSASPGPANRAARPGAALGAASRRLRKFALALPRATEDFPWGERVAKVNGKVFAFLGADHVAGGGIGLSVKLPSSGDAAVDLPFASPTGYGLGKSGWVTARFGPGDRPPVEILEAWILESYRAIAPKKLVAALDSTRERPAQATPTGAP